MTWLNQMRRALPVIASAAIGLALVAGGVGGCASDPGRDRATKATTGLRDTRQELTDAHQQVDKTLAAMSTVQSSQDNLKPAYEKFRDEIRATEDQAKRAAERSRDMQARAAEYQTKWQEEMSSVTSPELKAAASARADKIRGRFATVSAKAQDVRTAYQPFMQGLKDVQTYLSNDLTPAAVKAAEPVFAKARSAGQTLNQKLDALSAELDSVAADMSPKASGG